MVRREARGVIRDISECCQPRYGGTARRRRMPLYIARASVMALSAQQRRWRSARHYLLLALALRRCAPDSAGGEIRECACLLKICFLKRCQQHAVVYAFRAMSAEPRGLLSITLLRRGAPLPR